MQEEPIDPVPAPFRAGNAPDSLVEILNQSGGKQVILRTEMTVECPWGNFGTICYHAYRDSIVSSFHEHIAESFRNPVPGIIHRDIVSDRVASLH